MLGAGPPQASPGPPRPGALSARAASPGLARPGWREELGAPCGAATYLVPTQPSCRRSFALKMASRPRSAPRRSLGAGPGDATAPPGLLFGPGRRGGRCAQAVLWETFPAGFAAGSRCFRRPGEAWHSRCVRGRRRNLCLSSHRTGSESERPGPGPEPHCGVSPVPGQPHL